MKLGKDKTKALIGTLIFHGLLLTALLLLALHTPLPLPGEQGVEVALGNAETGFGSRAVQAPQKKLKPKKLTRPLTKPVSPPSKPAARPKANRQTNLTQNVEKAPSLPPKKTAKAEKSKPNKKKIKKTKPAQKPHDSTLIAKKTPPAQKPKPVINQRALFKLTPGNQNQGKGIRSGVNNMGKPHGFKESNAYNGQGGQGHGISYSLGNRGAKFLAKPATRFTEQGTVVVRIEVNPKGQVVRARVFAKGTTVVSEQLRKLAVQSAKNSLFSADPTAPAIQIGTITYHFILKR